MCKTDAKIDNLFHFTKKKATISNFPNHNLLFHFRCCNLSIALFRHLFIYNSRFKPYIRCHVIETKARKIV